MTSYFWSGFPSLSGRSDVMYGRRHIGGANPPATSPLSARTRSYDLSYLSPIAVVYHPSPSPVSSRVDRLDSSGRSFPPQLTKEPWSLPRVNEEYPDGANRPVVPSPRRIEFCPALRAKSKLVFDLMTVMRNYASNPVRRIYACTANWPERASERASGPSGGYISIIRGNYYERPSSSILIFCSRPLRPRQRLNSALCSPWR